MTLNKIYFATQTTESLDQPELLFDLRPNDSVLLCADDLLSGNSLNKTLSAVEARGGKVLSPVIVVANLSGKANLNGLEVISLIVDSLTAWPSSVCPLCKSSSEAVSARGNWKRLVGSINTTGDIIGRL